MRARTIACRQLVELVTDYLEGDLSPTQLRAVEEHLAACDDCARYLVQMRRVIALSRDTLDAKAVPADLPLGMLDGLLETFRGQRQR